jgi:hypothetical protein
LRITAHLADVSDEARLLRFRDEVAEQHRTGIYAGFRARPATSIACFTSHAGRDIYGCIVALLHWRAAMPNEVFLAYWLGFQPGGPPLEATPTSVGIVALAFAVTARRVPTATRLRSIF